MRPSEGSFFPAELDFYHIPGVPKNVPTLTLYFEAGTTIMSRILGVAVSPDPYNSFDTYRCFSRPLYNSFNTLPIAVSPEQYDSFDTLPIAVSPDPYNSFDTLLFLQTSTIHLILMPG